MGKKVSATTNNSANIKKNILIVDDSETVREFIQSILNEEFTTLAKNDGLEALDYLKQGNRPDLILSDMEMPNMNGRTFVRRVNSDPRFGQIPIIFVTAVKSEMLVNSFKNMGNVDFIFKPFKPEELVEKVNTILRYN